MIKAKDAIAAGRALLGTPYGSGDGQLDCINFIKKIIRTAPGGDKSYTTSGTNALWRSYEASGKYHDLTWRQEGAAGAKAGMLAFKRDGANVHHVGLCTGEGTVLHSSSAMGQVVETDLGNGQWALLARHRLIEVAGDAVVSDVVSEPVSDEKALYYADVMTEKDPLRVRDAPAGGQIIAHVPKGARVEVLEDGDWPRIRCGETVGYASGEYLQRADETQDSPQTAPQQNQQKDPNLGSETDGKAAIYLSPETATEVLRALSAALYAD